MTLVERVLFGCLVVAVLAVATSALAPMRAHVPGGESVTCSSAHMSPSTILAKSFDQRHVTLISARQRRAAQQFQQTCHAAANTRLWAITAALTFAGVVACVSWAFDRRRRHATPIADRR